VQGRCHVFGLDQSGGSRGLGLLFTMVVVLWSAVRTGSQEGGLAGDIHGVDDLEMSGAGGDVGGSGGYAESASKRPAARDDEATGVCAY
jgi:hypothetical protein